MYCDELPPRSRKTIGRVMKHKGRMAPYVHSTVKSKPFKGPKLYPHSCTKAGHSRTRKVVSYSRMPYRRVNRIIHSGAQTMLE